MRTPLIDLQVLTTQNRYQVDEEKIIKLGDTLLNHLGMAKKELSLLIVNDPQIKELNRDYRGKDKATDVLSFPQCEWESPLISEEIKSPKPLEPLLGDIIISLDHTEKSALSLGHSIAREFCFLMIHGLLHLCGHDHMKKEEEELMTEEQRKLLKFLEKESDTKEKPLWFECITIKKDSK